MVLTGCAASSGGAVTAEPAGAARQRCREGSQPDRADDTRSRQGTGRRGAGDRLSQQATRPDKVLVIIEENHTQRSALSQMPYLASFSRTYGRTSAYKAVTHPSLPNYLAIIGGSTYGVKSNLARSATA